MKLFIFGDFPMFDLQVVALAKKPHEKAKATAVKAWNG
jgi:hypothetical protein